jgi:hypothetical protein
MHSADSEYRRIRNLAAAVLTHNVRDPHPMRATVHPTWQLAAPHSDPAPMGPRPIEPPFVPTKGAPNAGRVLNIARLRQRRGHLVDLDPDPEPDAAEDAPDLPGIGVSRILIGADASAARARPSCL